MADGKLASVISTSFLKVHVFNPLLKVSPPFLITIVCFLLFRFALSQLNWNDKWIGNYTKDYHEDPPNISAKNRCIPTGNRAEFSKFLMVSLRTAMAPLGSDWKKRRFWNSSTAVAWHAGLVIEAPIVNFCFFLFLRFPPLPLCCQFALGVLWRVLLRSLIKILWKVLLGNLENSPPKPPSPPHRVPGKVPKSPAKSPSSRPNPHIQICAQVLSAPRQVTYKWATCRKCLSNLIVGFDLGFWIWDFDFLNFDFGILDFWILELGFWILDYGF